METGCFFFFWRVLADHLVTVTSNMRFECWDLHETLCCSGKRRFRCGKVGALARRFRASSLELELRLPGDFFLG